MSETDIPPVKRLVIVEDDETFARTLKRSFERRGYAVRLAASHEDLVVLLADDVRNTGKTFEQCAGLVRKAGGTVIATVEICDRMEAVADAGVPNYALAEYRAPENYLASDCPMCEAGQPVTEF